MSAHARLLRAIAAPLLALALALGGLAARAQGPGRHLALGNPSGAAADPARPDNYLISREGYALSYHRDRGTPTWVSWHLQAGDLGDTPRYTGDFITDAALPAGWPRAAHADYTGSGYDRGHLTPSADRTASAAANESTFILTNVVPQAPANNQGLWADLEAEARDLVAQGNELYIVAGAAGSLGTLAGGKLTIPAALWKAIVVLPARDGDDAARVTAETRVIAIWTPNDATVEGQRWEAYATSVRCIEQRTGLDLFAAVADAAEAAIAGPACPESAGPRVYLPLLAAAASALPPANVVIAAVVFDPPGDDLAGEYVLLGNTGGRPADLSGWTLEDEAGARYTFPAVTLAPGAELRIWTGAGSDGDGSLYWGRAQPVWNNGGDTATLRDAAGALVASLAFP